MLQRITPFLWFDDRAEQAAVFYTGVFRDSKIVTITRYGEAGKEVHGRCVALNGGPRFSFNQAISFVVNCQSQEEVDSYWDKLSGDGGKPASARRRAAAHHRQNLARDVARVGI